MGCTAGQCFLDKPLRQRAPRGGPGLPSRRPLPSARIPSAVAGDAIVYARAVVPSGCPAPADHADEGASCGACGPTCRACEPCRQKYGHLDVPAAGSAPAGMVDEVMTVTLPLARRSAATSLAPRRVMPSGAAAMPARPWAQLSPAEQRAAFGCAADRVIDRALARPAGDPVPLYVQTYGVSQAQWDAFNTGERQDAVYGGSAGVQRSLAALAARQNPDALPEWAREAGITQSTWATMNTAQREQARQQYVANSNVGWNVANTALQQGSAIVQSILNGDLQRDLANITAQSAQNVAATNAASAQFVAETNQRIADLNLAAAQANAQGNSAQAAQFQQAIQALQAAQSGQSNALADALRAMQPAPMSTTTKVALGLGAAALLGLGVVLVARKG